MIQSLAFGGLGLGTLKSFKLPGIKFSKLFKIAKVSSSLKFVIIQYIHEPALSFFCSRLMISLKSQKIRKRIDYIGKALFSKISSVDHTCCRTQ